MTSSSIQARTSAVVVVIPCDFPSELEFGVRVRVSHLWVLRDLTTRAKWSGNRVGGYVCSYRLVYFYDMLVFHRGILDGCGRIRRHLTPICSLIYQPLLPWPRNSVAIYGRRNVVRWRMQKIRAVNCFSLNRDDPLPLKKRFDPKAGHALVWVVRPRPTRPAAT